MSHTRDVLQQAIRWTSEGRSVALATVVSTWGSAPRAAGSHMAVTEDGEFVGSVSGGCIEGAVVHEAAQVLAVREPRTLEFGVTNDMAWEVGLACGGRIEIYVEPIDLFDRGILDRVLEARAQGNPVVLATRLDSGTHALLAPMAQNSDDSRWPTEAAKRAILTDTTLVHEHAETRTLLRPYNREPRLIVVGAVHIAQHLVDLGARMGFRCIVVDPREAFTKEYRFSDVEMIRKWPDDALEELAPDHRTAVVVLTHDPKFDDPALIGALATNAFYIGVLGGRKTREQRVERLRSRGISEVDLERLHAPIGLSIGARSPAEIALAIIAEIVQTLRRG